MVVFPYKIVIFPLNHPLWGTPNYDATTVGDFLSTPFANQLSSDCHLFILIPYPNIKHPPNGPNYVEIFIKSWFLRGCLY